MNNLYWTPARFASSLSAQKNIVNGIAGLDANAKVSIANLPGITMNAVCTNTTLTACTGNASAVRGDICIATTDSKSYILSTNTPANIGDWQELLNPAAPVASVNGVIGNVNFIGTSGVDVTGTTISLTSVGTAGIYGSATQIPVITTDGQGRVTNVVNTTIPTATAGQLGLLSPTDYVRFDSKQDLIPTGTVGQYYRGDKTWATLDTSAIPENGNLYYTQGRFDAALAAKSTTDVAEGTNLYYTNARARLSLSAATGISYNSTTGTISDLFTASTGIARTGNNFALTSVGTAGTYGSATQIPVFTTDAQGRITSVTNTAIPADLVSSVFGRAGAITAQSGDYTTTQVTEGANLYYTQSRFDTALAAKSTTNLTEGTNLYYTQSRFNSALAAKSTTDVAEGANLYFTDTRSRAALSASDPLAYNNTTGAFSIGQATTGTN